MLAILFTAVGAWAVYAWIQRTNAVGHRTLGHSCLSVTMAIIGLALALAVLVGAAAVGGMEGWLQP
jgi:hypothetical protein